MTGVQKINRAPAFMDRLEFLHVVGGNSIEETVTTI